MNRDLKSLADLQSYAPVEYEAWATLNAIVARRDGSIPAKYRELIAVAVAHASRCGYCIAVHTNAAGACGAGKAEIAEAILLAAAMTAGAVAAHGTLAMKLLPQERKTRRTMKQPVRPTRNLR